MPRIFVYARVSTTDQNVKNQIEEINRAGFQVEPHRIVSETISGSTAISERIGFMKLLERLEQGDVLVVTRLDRLGRDAIDVSKTVAQLEKLGVRLHCLALGGVDLTSSAGKMTMYVINAVAQFERDLLIERTQSGLERAKAEGKRLGRPRLLTDNEQQEIRSSLLKGTTISALAKQHKVSRMTIMRIKAGA